MSAEGACERVENGGVFYKSERTSGKLDMEEMILLTQKDDELIRTLSPSHLSFISLHSIRSSFHPGHPRVWRLEKKAACVSLAALVLSAVYRSLRLTVSLSSNSDSLCAPAKVTHVHSAELQPVYQPPLHF